MKVKMKAKFEIRMKIGAKIELKVKTMKIIFYIVPRGVEGL